METTSAPAKKAGIGIPFFVRILLYAVLIALACIFLREESGIWRTLPLVLILPPIASCFYRNHILTVGLCAVLSYFVVTVESSDPKNALITAISAAIICFIGIMIRRLAVTAKVRAEKRKLCMILAVILAAVGIAGYFFIFGDPVSYLIGKNKNHAYISETYKNSMITEKYTAFSLTERIYYTRTESNSDPSDVFFADVFERKDGTFCDGIRNHYEFVILNGRAGELSKIIKSAFDYSAEVRVGKIETDGVIDESVSAESVSELCSFDIGLYGQYDDPGYFAAVCETVFNHIEKVGFKFHTLNFYGAYADSFTYTLSLPHEFSGSAAQSVEPFSPDSFVRYYSESDYMYHWSY